ncbi:MBL fold metallo-hydrolase [Comamonas aquatica]|uniref:MBL fold metallo-hydrolase n=1 Tax=Comamonas aquatica TaxID=225991 RepID=A0AA42HRB1_9BURK|nr:MBL fold metallo-hydrolase [Comamonas aquatica]MDH0363085.1 MBL fold metallo-hydrolase [Comamonas aquatica]MDH1429879.1 MBL fold metallo-hydrolase [Comamonas aquatica]MDH1606898.1 MBL fold metallo-hydrolase [Comamonas aquatica]MDH1618634.1 MBL fold metallo-hydrolase [Comamonas aquatica]MDH1767252.1 MBL fold metallo-hydrolase [Comamonas aquatica]
MPQDSTTPGLWPGMFFFERGWLSANNILLLGPDDAALVDTGYCSHAEQTVELVASTLDTRPLTHVLNTHLHSDHCGGNAALQARWPEVQTWIAPGQAAQVQDWDPVALSYTPTGQSCPRFRADGVLQPGSTVTLGGRPWQVHAAPGHDPHSIVLFEPERRLLISADALWEHGFGVVFPEIEGAQAFAEVAATLDVIEQLQPALVLPGHGPLFTDVDAALARARQRLQGFITQPERHARYAAKVLLKYKLLEWQQLPLDQVQAWCRQTPYLGLLHARYFDAQSPAQWVETLVQELVASQAAALEVRDGTPVLLNR